MLDTFRFRIVIGLVELKLFTAFTFTVGLDNPNSFEFVLQRRLDPKNDALQA
ncbi:Uncharacterised protein [Mycobacterium tuberculosis]|nr:Uncharacterised protein [Mycobacterium tuberculosis]